MQKSSFGEGGQARYLVLGRLNNLCQVILQWLNKGKQIEMRSLYELDLQHLSLSPLSPHWLSFKVHSLEGWQAADASVP